MNQLINIENQNGIQLVDARLLHKKLESKRQFTDWISQRIEKYGFVENEDYFIDIQGLSQISEKPLGGRPEKNYSLTITMAKELAMLQDNEIGRKIRRDFIALEKQSKTTLLQIPKSIFVEGVIECVPYDWWLLQNGYSVSSGQFHKRIRKHGDKYFYKGANNKWYITRGYADALLKHRETGKILLECAPLPKWEQITIF